METRWIMPESVAELAGALAAELDVAPFVAELLVRRGIAEPEQARKFLDPKLKSLRDPFLVKGMDAAVDRLWLAVERSERIVLYGDYDVDGVSSLALLSRVLEAVGGRVECFLPMRQGEGYGLSRAGLERCLGGGIPELLVAVDCGTTAVAEVAFLMGHGVDVVIVDHHEPKTELPECVALVNPKLGGDGQGLCSVGLCFKLAHALLKRRPVPGLDLREYLDLVTLGTVADLVPLTDENRILVRRGLLQLGDTRWAGIGELVAVSEVRFPVSPSQVGFQLGPRLNAAGRIGSAADALELLVTPDRARARVLARSLDEQNRERRAVEEAVTKEAEAQLASWYDPARHAGIVLGGDGWHPGVVGIVASRIVRQYHRPVFVVGFGEDGSGKGSGRSIEGLSLVQALDECRSLLEGYGGHEMAAGVTLRKERLEEFREAFAECAARYLQGGKLQRSLRIDACLALAEIDLELLRQHEALQPFGMGNPQPLFAVRRVQPAEEPRILKEKHLSLMLQQGSRRQRAIWFGAAAGPLPRPPWDVAFYLERNEYRDQVTAQMQIQAIRSSEPVSSQSA
ncbi:MAG: Single-stranded-DNA-specific exonuclease RecJ [Verrucomicrobiota bacterium]